jgi:hypothetical protein
VCVCVFECVTFNKFKYQTVGKAFQNKVINGVFDVLGLIRTFSNPFYVPSLNL